MSVTIDYGAGVFEAATTGTAKTVVGGGDPYLDSVTLLMNFEGVNNSDTFKDLSGNTTLAHSGTVSIATNRKKFGNSSAEFLSGYIYPTSSNNGVMDFGTGDFTIEAWVWRASAGSRDFIVDSRQNTGNAGAFFLRVDSDDKLEAGPYIASSNYTSIKSTTSVPPQVWTHCAVTRQGDTIRVFVDGVLENTQTGFASISFVEDVNYTYPPIIGTTGFTWGSATPELEGHMDDLRITKGVARYTASFTPSQNSISKSPVINPDEADAFVIDANDISANVVFDTPSTQVASFSASIYGTSVTSYYDIANIDPEAGSITATNQTETAYGLYIDPNSNYAFTLNLDGYVKRYDFQTEWDTSTFTSPNQTKAAPLNVAPSTTNSNWFDLYFTPDGLTMFATNFNTDAIYKYSLSTPYDLSTLGSDPTQSVTLFDLGETFGNFDVSSETFTFGIYFRSDGKKIYLTGSTNNSIYEITLSTAWDLSSATAVVDYDLPSSGAGVSVNNPYSVWVDDSGTNLYLLNQSTGAIYLFNMSTAWDLNTISYSGTSKEFATVTTYNFAFDSSGTKLITLDKLNQSRFIEYDTSFGGEATTYTWPDNVKWEGGVAPTTPDVGETDTLAFYTDNGGIDWYGFKLADDIRIDTSGFGGIAYVTPGTYSWTCPEGVTEVSVVAVGPGATNAGGGGGLTWANGLSVTPGQSYTVIVGEGRYTGSNVESSFNGASCRALGGGSGGGSGGAGGLASQAVGATSYGGGYGGAWGGGAGGYSGNGGVGYGYLNTTDPGTDGSGGGGGGGGNQLFPNNGGGGGVGLYGEGASGSYPGGGGSGGGNSTAGGTASVSGVFGGGGVYGSANDINKVNSRGSNGAVRIIWGPGRAFPSTNTSLAASLGNETQV